MTAVLNPDCQINSARVVISIAENKTNPHSKMPHNAIINAMLRFIHFVVQISPKLQICIVSVSTTYSSFGFIFCLDFII